MALEVAVYGIAGHRRSTVCCQAMYAGIKAVGDHARLLVESDYRAPHFDLAVFYGYTPTLRQIMAEYIAAGRHAVYIDLGYWGREGLHGHHKISVDGRHPTPYFRAGEHNGVRARKLGLAVEPWRGRGKHILLAGMGAKAAEVEGKAPEEFERSAIEWLQRVTDRKIIYRPKPSWMQSQPLAGTRFSWGGPPRPGYRTERLHEVLKDCHAIVTHHSNVAVEGIVAGIPAWCWKGVAVPMASQDPRSIDDPYRPEGREQWVNDITYCQWSVEEMSAGLPWRHLKNEGLI